MLRRRVARVLAPASIASAMTIATAGITGPKGTTIFAGATWPEARCAAAAPRAGRDVDDQPADGAGRRHARERPGRGQHQRHRGGEDDRDHRRAESAADPAEQPRHVAVARPARTGCAIPTAPGPCCSRGREHRAERDDRGAGRAHEQHRGVGERRLRRGQSGSVPSATTCASVRTMVTTMIVMMSANGTARCGSFASPAGTGITS